MALGGPLQGHLVGVASFTNSGTIDLQSNPVAGDVLVITRARQAGLGPTFPIAGAAGSAFISNGGTLRLDTVLNQGGAATHSDTLVVDGTSVGAGGPTSMAIRNAGGGGALTVGDGILVTQVLDGTSSAAGAFSLQGGSITAGAFDYFLFKGGPSRVRKVTGICARRSYKGGRRHPARRRCLRSPRAQRRSRCSSPASR